VLLLKHINRSLVSGDDATGAGGLDLRDGRHVRHVRDVRAASEELSLVQLVD
jgi:hypothetical protein